jgi:hypothetical protein
VNSPIHQFLVFSSTDPIKCRRFGRFEYSLYFLAVWIIILSGMAFIDKRKIKNWLKLLKIKIILPGGCNHAKPDRQSLS